MGDMSNKGKLETLDLILQKRMRRNVTETPSKGHIVFGNYDFMCFQLDRGWHSFRPGLNIPKATGDDSDGLFELYPIRLAFPQGSLPSGSMKDNCKYWKKLVKEDRLEQGIIALIMLNLSEDVVFNLPDPQALYRQVCQKVEEIAADISADCLKESRCCVFYSIGYCDFAILMDTRRLDIVGHLLKGLSVPIQGQKSPFSTSCPLYGIHPKRCSENDLAKDDRARLAMRFSLHPGILPETFISALRSELIEEGKLKRFFPVEEEQRQVTECLERIREDEIPCVEEIGLSGSNEIFFQLDLPPRLVVRLFQEGAPFNPFSRFRADYIHEAETSIRMPLESSKSAASAAMTDFGLQKVSTRTLPHSTAFLEEFYDFRRKMKLPTRSGMALEQLFKRYEDLLTNTHAFDIGHILDDLFLALMFNIKQIENSVRQSGEDDDLERIRLLDQLDASINIFREKVGNYLSDLALSDKAFAKEYVLIHPSIGSATKLLIAYNQIINSLMDALGDNLCSVALMQDEEMNAVCPKHQHNFVVISGGCDETAAYDVFGQLDGITAQDGSHWDVRLVVLQFPEMTLFDIEGTLFQALHEAYHFAGERFRKQRKTAIDQALASFLADHYAEVFMDNIRLEEWIDSLWLSLEHRDSLKKVYQNDLIPTQHQKLKVALQKLFADTIERYVDSRLKECKEDFHLRNISEELLYYSRYIYEEYEEALCFLLGNSFTPINISLQKGSVGRDELQGENERLFLEIYELAEEAICDVHASVLRYCHDLGIDSGSISHANMHVRYWGEKGRFKDLSAFELLWSINEWLVGGTLQPPNRTWKPLQRNVLDFFQDFGIACRESYSDIMALVTLQMKWYEFFAAMAYECWNMDKLLPDNVQNVLRIGADLKVYYGISGKLSRDQRKELNQYWLMRRAEKIRFALEIDATQLANRIDEILEDYAYYESVGVTGPLEEYLDGCRCWLEKIETVHDGKKDTIFTFLRELNKSAEKDLQKSLMAFLKRWSLLAEPPDWETDASSKREGV